MISDSLPCVGPVFYVLLGVYSWCFLLVCAVVVGLFLVVVGFFLRSLLFEEKKMRTWVPKVLLLGWGLYLEVLKTFVKIRKANQRGPSPRLQSFTFS